MTEEKALIPTHSSLDMYGSGEDIKNLSNRIKTSLPGGNKLSASDALALAQLSVAYGLNPFNGEVWVIIDKNGVSRGTMVGIKGLRKAARKQSNYWPVFDVLSKPEKQELSIPEAAVAYRCKIYRTDTLREAAESVDILYKSGMKNAFEIYAYKPAEGIGYCMPGESSRMKTDQAARKRAEADALKVAFDLPFASEVSGGEQVGYVDTEWEVLDTTPKLTGEALQEKVAENVRVLRGDPDEPGFGDEPDLDDFLAEPEIPDFPHDSMGFFGAVNAATNHRYLTTKDLGTFLKAQGKTGWPAATNNEGWNELWLLATKEEQPF